MDIPTAIRPPIVLDERGDLQVYPSSAAACYAVEAIDVQDGAYETFDGLGRVLEFEIVDDVVSLRVRHDARADIAELDRRTRSYIQRNGPDVIGIPVLSDASLDDLLDALMAAQERYRPKPG